MDGRRQNSKRHCMLASYLRPLRHFHRGLLYSSWVKTMMTSELLSKPKTELFVPGNYHEGLIVWSDVLDRTYFQISHSSGDHSELHLCNESPHQFVLRRLQRWVRGTPVERPLHLFDSRKFSCRLPPQYIFHG